VALVRTVVSDERIASIISVTRIDEVGTTLAVSSNGITLRRNDLSVLTRATQRHITEDGILCITEDGILFPCLYPRLS
jgi:hypothetical protein